MPQTPQPSNLFPSGGWRSWKTSSEKVVFFHSAATGACMHKAILAIGLAAVLGTAAPALAAGSKARAVAHMIGREGQAMGTVSFAATSHGVLIDYDLKGLTPGVHAIHIHTSGNCDPKTAFTSAGPHFSFDPTKMHGFFVPHSPHAGDLPNEYAATDGTLRASVISNAFSLGNGKKSIFDRDGAAIIVHAKGDDYVSQPAGNSGDRVACGVIMRTIGPAARKGAKRKAHT
jgi:superoxide dismutase, Cu-Zn family